MRLFTMEVEVSGRLQITGITTILTILILEMEFLRKKKDTVQMFGLMKL